MTTPTKIGIGFLSLLFAVMLAIGFFKGCKPEPVPVQPAETERKGIMNPEAEKSKKEVDYRAPLLARIKADSVELAKLRAKLPKSKDKAVASVKTYRNNPTPANCDTAIAGLQHHSSQLETGLLIADSVMKGQSLVIASYAGTVARKDSALTALNTGWQKANAENAVLTRKVKRKNKLLKIGAGIIAVLVGVVAVR